MSKLQIPYIRQESPGACGAATFQMACLALEVRPSTQEELMCRYKKLEPHGSGRFLITTDDLVNEFRSIGLKASWKRADLNNFSSTITGLKTLTNAGSILIICQQLSLNEPLIGHFRIITAITDAHIILHDPHPEYGGANIKQSHEQAAEMWEATGKNVTGGVYIVIKKDHMTRERAQELIDIYGQAWMERDAELILSVFTPDATYFDPAEGEVKGHQGIKNYWEFKVLESQKDIDFTLLNVWIDGDTVIAEWNAKFTDTRRQLKIDMTEVAIFETRDDKFSSLREYYRSVKTPV